MFWNTVLLFIQQPLPLPPLILPVLFYLPKYLGCLTCGEFSGYQLVYVEGERFWRKLWLAAGDTLLFVTYNCQRADEDSELAHINEIIGTFKRA
jgi:hypothetical protein